MDGPRLAHRCRQIGAPTDLATLIDPATDVCVDRPRNAARRIDSKITKRGNTAPVYTCRNSYAAVCKSHCSVSNRQYTRENKGETDASKVVYALNGIQEVRGSIPLISTAENASLVGVVQETVQETQKPPTRCHG